MRVVVERAEDGFATTHHDSDEVDTTVRIIVVRHMRTMRRSGHRRGILGVRAFSGVRAWQACDGDTSRVGGGTIFLGRALFWRHYFGVSFGGIILAEGAEDGGMDEDMKAGIDAWAAGAGINRGIRFGMLELRLETRLPIG